MRCNKCILDIRYLWWAYQYVIPLYLFCIQISELWPNLLNQNLSRRSLGISVMNYPSWFLRADKLGKHCCNWWRSWRGILLSETHFTGRQFPVIQGLIISKFVILLHGILPLLFPLICLSFTLSFFPVLTEWARRWDYADMSPFCSLSLQMHLVGVWRGSWIFLAKIQGSGGDS